MSENNHNTFKIQERVRETFESKIDLLNINKQKYRINFRNDYISEYLMSKRFKSYEDVEDSLGAFNKDNNLVEFTQLNLLYDMNIEEILGYLNQIKFQGIEHFLSNPENVKQIIISLRKLICRNLNKNNEQLLNYGCDVMMIDIIQYYSENKLNNLTETDYEILYEIFWSISNLVCISESPIFKTILEKNFIFYLSDYFDLKREELLKEILCCLGNIVAENISFRNLVLSNTILINKLIILSKNLNNSLSLNKNLIFTLKSLSRGNPKPPLEKISEIISVVSAYLWSKNDDVIIDSIWTLSFLSDGPEEYQTKIIKSGIMEKINEYAKYKINQVQIPCLRIIGNLFAGENFNIEILFEQGCFETLSSLVYNNLENSEIINEIIWCFINLSKTNIKIINLMIEDRKFMQSVTSALKKIGEINILGKFIKLLINLVRNGNEGTKQKLYEASIINTIESCFEKNSTSHEILKFLIMFINEFIGIDTIENNLKEYIENLAITHSIAEISDIFKLLNSDNFLKLKATDLLNIYFISVIKNDNLKNMIFDIYSHWNFLATESQLCNNNDSCTNIHEKSIKGLKLITIILNSLKKLVECIKYSEMLFEFY